MASDTSPRPWRLLEGKIPGYERYISVVHGDNLSICQMSGAGSLNPKVMERVRADAELIISAVNERQEVREAIEDVLRVADRKTVEFDRLRAVYQRLK